MEKLLSEIIKNKKVLILGYGREGKSTLKMLMKVGGFLSLTVSDSRDVSSELPGEVCLVTGDNYLDCIDDYDLCIKSPGVVLPKDISEYSCEMTSETEVFIKAYRNQVIGITGTKGKSTTSSLLNHVLRHAGKNVLFAGNIGIPVFEIASEVKDDSIIVLELSCHQLEYAKTAPHRAILLNIYEDHLDHYGTREKYSLAKQNIYISQESDDFLYTTSETLSEIKKAPSIVKCIDLKLAPIERFEDYPKITLRGSHNLLNATFVYEVAKEYGVTREGFIEALESFETLPHRLQFVCKKNGVDYYDDSISTTVKSTISAVESISNASILLVGGMERNIEYEELVDYVLKSKLKYVICMYSSGKRFYEMCVNKGISEDSPKLILKDELSDAMEYAKKVSMPGDAVILSPAAASYGYFKNFEERGDVFQKIAKN